MRGPQRDTVGALSAKAPFRASALTQPRLEAVYIILLGDRTAKGAAV